MYREHAVELFLHSHNIDILLISEARFTPLSYVSISGYTVYVTLHPSNKAHGGSAIIIKSTLKHHELQEYRTCHLQATTIEVQDWHGPLVISATYCPPRHRITNDMFTDYFLTLGHRFISGGDWNAKNQFFGSRKTVPKGRALKLSVDYNGLQVLTNAEPTHFPSDRDKIPDVLDFFIYKGISQFYMDIEKTLDSCSDHSQIISTISTTLIKKPTGCRLYNNKTDWNSFQDWIEENIQLNIPMKTKDDIDDATMYITTLIQNAAWRSTPGDDAHTNENITTFPREVKEKVLEKRRLRRVWQTSRHPQDKTSFNRACKELKELIQNIKNETFQRHLESLSPLEANEHSLWKATKKMNGPLKPVPALRKSNGEWARRDLEKAELFAIHLADTFKPHPQSEGTNEEPIVELLNSPFQMSLPIKPTSPSEVKKLFRQLQSRKTPGYDLITAKVLNELPRKACTFLTSLYNSVLRTGYFPSQWKFSQIIMINKPNKPQNEVSSYRPISLLPILSKVFEKILLKRLKPILTEEEIIPDHQFGFRTEHSTVEQVHRIVDTITDAFEKKKYCTAAFLDVEKAFDKVWHVGLLFKLKKLLPHPFFMLLKSYLEERRFQVKQNESLSPICTMEASVPQGSVLGPILYSIYTADLPKSTSVVTATFADDTAILSSDENPAVASNRLQESLVSIQEWMKSWRIKASPSKSSHVTFTLRRSNCPPIIFNDEILPQADHVKYLGMHLDRRLTWRHHIDTKKTALNLRLNKMYWLIGRHSSLSLENKLLVYKTILKPIWTYGIQLWGTASNSNVEILQRFQNKVLRTITNAPWFTRNTEVHEYLNIPLIKDEITKFSTKYQDRLQGHVNHLAINLLDNSESVRRLKRQHVLDLAT